MFQAKGSHYDSMSDSEMDDKWKAILNSRTKLNEVKMRLRNLEEDDHFIVNSEELVGFFFCFSKIDPESGLTLVMFVSGDFEGRVLRKHRLHFEVARRELRRGWDVHFQKD